MNRMELRQKFGFTNFTASLHTHVRSIFDAHIEADKLCKKIVDLGGSGCAITDHGVVSSIEDYKPVFKEHGLKLIPGCEMYVDAGILGRLHLILLAKNDNGWKGLSKIVTESNKTIQGSFPVIDSDTLFRMAKDYKGDIIATSACMQGVISAIFLSNDKINAKIAKIQENQNKYIAPGADIVTACMKKVKEAEEMRDAAIIKRDETKAYAEMRFSKREKTVKKMIQANDSGAADAFAKLEADKKASKIAKNELPKVKDALEKVKKNVSEANKELKKVEESVGKWLSYESSIESLRKELRSDAELYSVAKEVAASYAEAFEDNFYAEVQYHGIEEEAKCFPLVVKVAHELHIPLVAANDVHILEKSDDERLKRQILRSMRFGNDFEEENVGDEELYLKDNYELAESLLQILPENDVIEAINNIDTIFNSCNVEFATGKHYPKFDKTADANKLLDAEVEKGIKWRFPNGMDKEHKDRLQYELQIIKSMGYADYHLVVKDFLEYGRLLGYVPKNRLDEAPLTIEGLKMFIKENGWENGGFMVGPGRGSAVGSLVCYLLGITALDPLKYGLLFERFLNPERVSMPDIDSDIANTTRSKVIEYVQNRYGKMAVCGIMTTNAQAPKGSLNIAAKYYGLKYKGEPLTSLGRELAKEVPEEVGISFNTAINTDGTTLKEQMLKAHNSNKDAVAIINWASIIEGSFTAYGAHAAGIVIADNDDISDYLPLRMNTTLGMYTTQCDMVQVEENGLLKFDFLGLKTLDIITETTRMIEENTGIIVDPLRIDLEDKKVYETILSTGKTNSVFQFESDGMKAMLKRFKPETFEDLIILVSMYRPGPMQYLDDVIDVKNGKKTMTFLCDELESILGKTYGSIVYQEQVMEIFQKLAGYTLGGADMVRRYMSKKKSDKLAHERESFVNGDTSRNIKGCVGNGIKKEVAEELFTQMEAFAKYAFNKSHAAVYAFNAYITAYLKCYYAPEFFASALNWSTSKKLPGLMYEANTCGVSVTSPDINLSQKDFCVVNGKISFGLSAVAGVKDHADEILNERENGSFSSLKDFYMRTRQNVGVFENLIYAGAFDKFSKNREAMIQMAHELKQIVPDRDKKLSFIESAKKVLPYVESYTAEELINLQEESGLKAEIKEPTTVEKLEKRLETATTALSAMDKEISLIRLHDVKENKTERMAKEKEFLGMYVTEHPTDYYPTAKEIGTVPINELTTINGIAYGVITNLTIKYRRSDNARMAFFTLEDRTGSVDVCVFAKAYTKAANLIKEGKVVKLTGKLEGTELEDGEMEYQFIVEKMQSVQEKKSSYMMSVTSYAVFHVEIENLFKNEYADENGHSFLIFDSSMDEVRKMNYKVSDKVKLLPNVEETFIHI